MTPLFSIKQFCSAALCVAIAISSGSCWGQLMQQDEKPDPPPRNVALEYPVSELEAMSLEQLNAKLKELTPDFRKTLKAMWIAKARYEHADKADSYGYSKTWRENAIQGQTAYQKIKELSLQIYLKTEKPTDEQFKLAFQMALASVDEGRVGIVHRVLKKMSKLRPKDESVRTFAGRVAIFTNDFEAADSLLKTKPKLVEDLTRQEQILFENLDGFATLWTKEKAIREAEAKADDLPRVELMTSKGKIVIELFENEAPHTVGNFIHLVESGFYENTLFYPVIRNYRSQAGFVFQGKPPEMTDYKIVDESQAADARQVCRGSIASLPSGNTFCGAQFSIYSAPFPFGEQETVFGRVISGMDVVDVLKVNFRINKKTGGSERVNQKDTMPDDYIFVRKGTAETSRHQLSTKKTSRQ